MNEISCWIKPRQIKDVDEYLFAINQIQNATTGFVNVIESNQFFFEACQCLMNAISLFQQGYFDAAFYMLRQSIETSIGTLYLVSNKEKMDKWNNLEKGFEQGNMVRWLNNHEESLIEMKKWMPDFFTRINEDQKIMNKYVHKQGFQSFYTHQRNKKDEEAWMHNMQCEFERILCDSIGAVAVYRLALDAFPVALADVDLALRSPCLLTESLSIDFFEKYIGKSSIDGYKHTQIYKDTADWLSHRPKQSETVYYLIHYQIVNRNLMEEYYKQWDLLEFDDQLAVQIFLICNKICRLYLYGMIPYTSETNSLNSEMVLGDSYFKEIFAESPSDYNLKYKKAYISRVTIGTDYTYLEHNEVLSPDEIKEFQDYALKVSYEYKNTFEELVSFRESKQFN